MSHSIGHATADNHAETAALYDAVFGNETTNAVAESSLLSSHHFDPDAMTPESLMLYVSTRVGALDEQMTDVFERQQLSEKVRSELRGIQKELTNLAESSNPDQILHVSPETFEGIASHLRQLESLDPALGKEVRERMGREGQLFCGGNDGYYSAELENTRDFLGSISKDLESGAQLDMIQLQSFMSSRQTAIQLATNLIASLGESQKSIVTNIR